MLLQDIRLFVNSPGGSVTAGMGIYDAMQVGFCFSNSSPISARMSGCSSNEEQTPMSCFACVGACVKVGQNFCLKNHLNPMF